MIIIISAPVKRGVLMPIVVNKDKVRMDILMAFQRCIESKPMTKVTLRDIAAESGMSHAKLLNYFESRDDIVVSYVKYTKDYMTEKCVEWFAGHPREGYDSNLAYMNAFMEYVANGQEGEERPSATTQTYVLTHYNPRIAELVADEFREWRETMEKCLISVYGGEIGRHEAEAMMILISGTFICNYTHALTGEINNNIISFLSNLAKS